METQRNTLDFVQQNPIIPVYYNENPDTCKHILEACYTGGIRVFEFTDRGHNAQANFKILQKLRDEDFPDLKLGIGTIKTAEQARRFIEAQTDFIVSPTINPLVSAIAQENKVFWIPGCMTPTEISLAESLGASLIKLFPGDILGPGFLKAIKPLFPELKFMPTGGVDLTQENISAWLQAGVTAIGFGSKLFSQPEPEMKNYDWLTDRCRELIRKVTKK